jgi:hypothetical protein
MFNFAVYVQDRLTFNLLVSIVNHARSTRKYKKKYYSLTPRSSRASSAEYRGASVARILPFLLYQLPRVGHVSRGEVQTSKYSCVQS